MTDHAELARFYEDAYSQAPAQAAVYARWRALGAIGKADHVIALCGRGGVHPASTLEVGCGDGALLCELRRRGFGGRLSGVEITEAAVAIARERPQIDAVALYDGLHLRDADGAHELGILSHVLEHVPDPSALLAEVARACRAARMAGTAKWALRAGLHRLAPSLARRLFTVHYACLCRPAA